MMSYIDYINQFWIENCRKRFLPREMALYFLLLNECNRNYWVMPFLCSTEHICNHLQISKQTFYVARNTLAQRGLVSFTGGKWGSQSPSYSLLGLNENLSNGIRERTRGHTNDSTNNSTTWHTNDGTKERTKERPNGRTILKEGKRPYIDRQGYVTPTSHDSPDDDYLQKYKDIDGKWK